MLLLLRVSCWQSPQPCALHRALHPTQPHKACRLGYKAKQVYVIYWLHVCGVVAADIQFLRVQPMASLSIMVLTS